MTPLGWLAAACLVATLVLIGFHPHADTVTVGRTDCGSSSVSLVRQGAPNKGGELRPDDAAWSARCIAKARHRLQLAPIPLAVGLVAGVARLVVRRRIPVSHRTYRGSSASS
ncbi:hypothetical protein [Nocardioides sp. InS609-2]|uniref:hypothetical protein n=1 Tax=Nocardioides sp. InS609-2 TaxID=2760705 RepID=UPI0020BD6D9E|nr:hypothetical protein [Nocardioides sp. InS609-2]